MGQKKSEVITVFQTRPLDCLTALYCYKSKSYLRESYTSREPVVQRTRASSLTSAAHLRGRIHTFAGNILQVRVNMCISSVQAVYRTTCTLLLKVDLGLLTRCRRLPVRWLHQTPADMISKPGRSMRCAITRSKEQAINVHKANLIHGDKRLHRAKLATQCCSSSRYTH